MRIKYFIISLSILCCYVINSYVTNYFDGRVMGHEISRNNRSIHIFFDCACTVYMLSKDHFKSEFKIDQQNFYLILLFWCLFVCFAYFITTVTFCVSVFLTWKYRYYPLGGLYTKTWKREVLSYWHSRWIKLVEIRKEVDGCNSWLMLILKKNSANFIINNFLMIRFLGYCFM